MTLSGFAMSGPKMTPGKWRLTSRKWSSSTYALALSEVRIWGAHTTNDFCPPARMPAARHFSVIARDSEALPPHPMLELSLLPINDPRTSAPVVEVTLKNAGFVPARIERVFGRDRIYLMQMSRSPDHCETGPVGER